VTARSAAEKAFCTLGPVAEQWLRSAAASGNTRLGPELAELAALEAAHGRGALLAALERAITFGRWRASRVRSILAAGAGVAQPSRRRVAEMSGQKGPRYGRSGVTWRSS
jgi:hypothetical protein